MEPAAGAALAALVKPPSATGRSGAATARPGADSRAAPAPLAVRVSCANGSPDRGAGVLRAVATRLAVGPPARAHRPVRPSRLRSSTVSRTAGQGVRPPAAGADGFRTAAATVERAEAQRSRGTAPVPAYDRDGAGG